MTRQVWVEQNGHGLAFRIFKSEKMAIASRRSIVLMNRAQAVTEIRHQLFERSGGNCEGCDAPITEKSAHMHERVWRGHGGEISLVNSMMSCAECHDYFHRTRKPRFKKGLDICHVCGQNKS